MHHDVKNDDAKEARESLVILSMSKEEMMCPICLDLLHEPVLTSCGHDFCRACIDESLAHDLESCPICRNEFESSMPYSLNPRLHKQLAELYPEDSSRRKRMRDERDAEVANNQQPQNSRRRRLRAVRDFVFIVNAGGYRISDVDNSVNNVNDVNNEVGVDADEYWSSFFTAFGAPEIDMSNMHPLEPPPP